MIFTYNLNQVESPNMYLSKPNRRVVKKMLGIERARLSTDLRDVWTIDFEVNEKYTSNIGEIKKNPVYSELKQLMEIKVDNIGWFRINTTPEEHFNLADGRWYKSFKAYGYETTLQDIDVVGLKINYGTEDSYEMYEENINELGILRHNVQLYIKDASDNPTSDSYWKLGTLNIIEHEYLKDKGWSIGDIDSSLAQLRGRQFDIDNENLYRVLTDDFAVAYKCIFTFDRINKTISAVRLEDLGEDLNLELSFRNVLNSIDITDQNDDFYTRFRVAGNDEDQVIIEYINYGSSKIENLDYLISSGMLDDETVEKYNLYKTFVDEHRQDYADYSLTYLELQEKRTSIYEQVPIDEVEVLYTNLTDDELQVELQTNQKVIELLEQGYTDENGVLNIEGSVDYAYYMSVKEVIIPKIEAEIAAREDGSHAEEFEYETNWELYGINEITIKQTAYQRQVEVLKENGYDTPWTSSLDTNELYHNKQYDLYTQYTGYLEEIALRLEKLNTEIDEIDILSDECIQSRKALAAEVKITHEKWGFTQDELANINILYRDTDFQDTTVEILDTDTLSDIIQKAWDLFNSAKEQLEIESHPQLSYSTDLDNLFRISKFQKKANAISIGDFCFMELDNHYKTKQRIIHMDLELVDFNDTSLSFEFSNMTTVCGKADDYRFLLESTNGSSKNKITSETKSYISSTVSSMAGQLVTKYLSSGGSVFPNGVSQDDIQKLQDALDGLIGGVLSVDELQAKLAQIETLEADSAFITYLESQFLVGNQAQFKQLEALAAQIDNLLAGNVVAELGHIIKLTADTVSIDEAVIRDLIAAQISVSMLKAGTISTEQFKVASDDGGLEITGNTMQFKDADGNIRIQIGRDSNDNFTFTLYAADGSGILIDENGIHESAISDGLIVNDMVADGTLSKGKFAFDIVEGDGNGNIDIGKIVMDGESFEVSYQSIQTEVDNIANKIATIDLYGEQIFKNSNGEISPDSITVNAVVKNGAIVGKWYIDGIENTEYVSEDGASIVIPSSYMKSISNQTATIKVEDQAGELYDLYTLYLLEDTAGESAISVIISSESGLLFKNDTDITSSTFVCKVYRGTTEITPSSYEWKIINDDETEWATIGTTKEINIPVDKNIIRKRVKCLVDINDSSDLNE